MLIYKLLGQTALNNCAQSFGISYAMDQASQWKDIVQEALKAAIIMLVLERLYVSSPIAWMEDHIDFLSVQAVMLQQKLGFFGRVRAHTAFTQRLASDD